MQHHIPTADGFLRVCRVLGVVAAMETFAGQAYGAGAYSSLGEVLQRALGISLLCCCAVVLLWQWCAPVLIASVQVSLIWQSSRSQACCTVCTPVYTQSSAALNRQYAGPWVHNTARWSQVVTGKTHANMCAVGCCCLLAAAAIVFCTGQTACTSAVTEQDTEHVCACCGPALLLQSLRTPTLQPLQCNSCVH